MSKPLVSIGVPVYNGQKYIRFTIESLLAQTMSDFEIIVTDNCSTDTTPQIVAEYASRDSRIKYIKNRTNVGPALNYKISCEHAQGHYFKWNPADDVCAPTFLEKCVAVLDSDASVVLSYPLTQIIDTQGKVVDEYHYELGLDDPNPAPRLWRLMTADHRRHGAHELYGVIRTSELRKTPCMRPHVRGDSVLLARLALLGRFHRVNEYLFMNRDHSDRSSKYLSRKAVRPGSRLSRYIGCGPLPSAEWWDPSLKGRIVYPEWRVFREYLRAVQETSLSPVDRKACYRTLALFGVRHSPKLVRDLLIALEQKTTSFLGVSQAPDIPQRRQLA